MSERSEATHEYSLPPYHPDHRDMESEIDDLWDGDDE